MLIAKMAPAPKADAAAKAIAMQQQQQHPARASSKQPLLKSKYYQQPGRTSFSADPNTASDSPTSPILLQATKSPDTPGGINDLITTTTRSPELELRPADMGFDGPPSPKLHYNQASPPTGRASASPRTSTDSTGARGSGSKPGHRHTKSGGHISDISMTTMPARKPLRDSSLRVASVDTAALDGTTKSDQPESGRKSSDANPTLRPIAYSPEPRSEDHNTRSSWDGESRSSWHAGDDNPEVKSPQPSGSKHNRKSSVMPTAPPQLPLLYFEQESIDQMDFAYQDPRPASSRFSASQLNLELKPTDSSLSLGLSGDEETTSKPEEKEGETSTDEEEDETDEIPAKSPELPRHTPLPPLDPSIQLDDPPLEETEMKEEEQDGKDKDNVDAEPEKKPENERGLETPTSEADKTGEEGSFYWNSPRSSTEDGGRAKQEGRRKAKLEPEPPEEEDLDSTTPKKPPTPKKSHSPGPAEALVSASALGLGGPSDWEHFGDYDAEEIDDIDLYASPKTKDTPTSFSTSFNTAVTEVEPDDEDEDVIDLDEPNNIPQRPFLERKILSTIEERESENFEDLFSEKNFGDQHRESINTRSAFDANPPPSAKDAHHSLSGTGDLRARQSAASSSAETIERISFHVPPPPDSAASETSSTHSGDERTPDSVDANGQPGLASVVGLVPNDSDRSPFSEADVKTPRPIDDTASSADTEARSESVSQGVKTRHASSVLSPTSEDGQEFITISLQVPPQAEQANEPNGTSQTPTMDDRGQDARDVRRSIYPGSIALDNPYANLEAWARASLNRYVKVLHDEANADSNEDKYKIFTNFMHNEQRIRAVFYDQDDESDASDQPVNHLVDRAAGPPTASHQKTPSAAGLRISKALPALPTEPEPTPVASPDPMRFEEPSHSSGESSSQSLEPNKVMHGTNGSSPHAQRADTPTSGHEDELAPDSPIADRPNKVLKEKGSGNLRGAPSLNALRKALDIVTTRKSSLTSKDTQAMARASIARASGQPTRAEFGADVKNPSVIISPADTMNDGLGNGRSVDRSSPTGDTDVNQNEGKPYEGDKAANRQSIYQPFSTMLRQSSIRSGPSEAGDRRARHNGQSGSGSFDTEEGKHSPISPRNKNPAKSPSYRYTILEPLLAVVPQESILRQEPEQLERLRQGMDAVPDDFSFIHKTVLAWDAEAKQLRERCERERHARSGQNEQRIDELFNEHEIGYSDISRLEADFKRAEGAKKAEEDREEVQTFVASVFDVVWARINYEMDQLTPLYDECTRLVASASAGRDMFEEDPTGGVPIAPAMEALLILYQKLMVRHQKAFEAVLERDRRLKKVEVAPWYALGAVDKVKRIERRFEDAEKKAILEFCRQRDERANLLMDVLDQNTLRGVGANQDYMESVMQAVRTISTELAMGAVGEDDIVSTNEVLKAKTITTALARSSEQIVQTFHVADMLLNAADYEVSVANAKLSGADAAAFRRLRDAKAKEDHKLALDLEHRMGLIRSDTMRTQDEVTKLLMLIQDRQGSNAAAAAIAEGGMDPEREQRLRKALEDVTMAGGGPPVDT